MNRILPVTVGGKKQVVVIREGYDARSRLGAELCANGIHRHNAIDDECCPCFRCCVDIPVDTTPRPHRCVRCDERYDGYIKHMLADGEVCTEVYLEPVLQF